MIQQAKITTASILFLTIASLHVFGILFSENLAFISKPFLMTTLLVVYLVSVKKPDFWFISALFFSFWGDVLLLFKNQFFIFGLASFLLAHVFYIKITIGFLKKTSYKKIALVASPFLVFLFSLLYLLKDNLGEMRIPVIIYGIVITIFGVVAFLNYVQVKSTANLWLFLGTLIFITSDSLIAINKFYAPNEMYQFLIMVTYILAQYLICKAFIVKTYIKE